jgi:NADH-quinone oxidoreductase subunit K
MILLKVHYILISSILYLIGVVGIIINRTNLIVMLMSLEIMLLAINISFITYSIFLDDLVGQLFAFFILTVAAAESAIGLAIIVVYFRVKSSISVESISLIKN